MHTIVSKIIYLLVVALVGVLFFQLVRPFPESLKTKNEPQQLAPESLQFFGDETAVGKDGKTVVRQTIADEALRMIANAHSFILLDMFAFNTFTQPGGEYARDLATEFTDALIAKKTKHASTTIMVILDPMNTAYGGMVSPEIEKLRASGIQVVEAKISALPDSNPLWGPFYHMFFSWFGNNTDAGWLSNPFSQDAPKVTLRTYASFFNVKLDHRKVLIADRKSGSSHTASALIMSLNAAKSGAADDNVAIKVTGSLWLPIFASETRLFIASGGTPPAFNTDQITGGQSGDAATTFITERNIQVAIMKTVEVATSSDSIDIAALHLSSEPLISALLDAAERGVKIRIILDQNERVFGMKAFGIPNKPVANRLFERSNGKIEIRWCETRGEECHSKLFLARTKDKETLILGSANFTQRSLENYNLEANIMVTAPIAIPVIRDARAYFDRAWENTLGVATAPYSTYGERNKWKNILQRVMEFTGAGWF